MTIDTTIVIPTIGRESLHTLLEAIDRAAGPRPAAIIVVDDRPDPRALGLPASIRVLNSGGAGPAAARNRGWRAAATSWVSFLDDDVIVTADWLRDLAADLQLDCDASKGRVRVPLPAGRNPTDGERSTKSLETARWITADMSVRRAMLERLGGFDERFTRAYREDSDLALRLRRRGGSIVEGNRSVCHPPRRERFWASVRQQRGNADDALMRALHGAHWRRSAGAPRGRKWWHLATVLSAAAALPAVATGRRRLGTVAGTGWLALTTTFALERILPGPRDRHELSRMALTSVAIPFAALWWASWGRIRCLGARVLPGWPQLVLFDRDGTIIENVPYNGRPDRVTPMLGAAQSLAELRAAGIRVGVVTNQSGVARNLITGSELEAVNQRVDRLLGPFDTWQTCRHGPDEQCDCRKPAPGMVRRACAELGIAAQDCAVIGDIGADVLAAERAGAVGILVPTAATRPEEIESAAHTQDCLADAVGFVLRGRP